MLNAPLVSMKRNPNSIDWGGPTMAGGESKYPYGLCIHLDNEQLAALSLNDKLPQVGTEMRLEAKVTVKSVSEDVQDGGESGEKTSRHVELQITDMALSTADENKPKAETTLYSTPQQG